MAFTFDEYLTEKEQARQRRARKVLEKERRSAQVRKLFRGQDQDCPSRQSIKESLREKRTR